MRVLWLAGEQLGTYRAHIPGSHTAPTREMHPLFDYCHSQLSLDMTKTQPLFFSYSLMMEEHIDDIQPF